VAGLPDLSAHQIPGSLRRNSRQAVEQAIGRVPIYPRVGDMKLWSWFVTYSKFAEGRERRSVERARVVREGKKHSNRSTRWRGYQWVPRTSGCREERRAHVRLTAMAHKSAPEIGGGLRDSKGKLGRIWWLWAQQWYFSFSFILFSSPFQIQNFEFPFQLNFMINLFSH
jgi:hypothetical protein